MSRIKDLKNNPDSTFNIIELLMTLVPVKKSKYADLMYTVIKNKCEIGKDEYIRIRSELMSTYHIPVEHFDGMTPYQLVILSKIATSILSPSGWKTLGKFSEFNERGLIEENDITKYKNMSEIETSVKSTQLKIDMKEMEKYVKKIYEDDDGWMVIRPLTYQSALKYGYGTKWCTSSDSTTVQFDDYSKRGILIYTLNTKTGHKIACFKELKNNGEFSFWNEVDARIDSMESNVPLHIIDAIRKEITNFPQSNSTLKSDLEKNNVVGKSMPKTVKKMTELSRQLMDRRRLQKIEDISTLRVEVESDLSRYMNRNLNEIIHRNLDEIPERHFDNVSVSVDPANGLSDPFTVLFGRRQESDGSEMVPATSIVIDEFGLPNNSPTYIDELNKIRLEEQ